MDAWAVEKMLVIESKIDYLISELEKTKKKEVPTQQGQVKRSV